MTLRFSRRQRPTVLRMISWLVLGFSALWGAGFLVYLIGVFNAVPPNLLPPADGIVVLTGGDDRISESLALLARHEAPLMLISGVAKGTYLGDFTNDDRQAATDYAADITIGHVATTTHENGLEIAIWAKAHHMRSLVVVTADYHMPRAMLEIHRALRDARLIPYPVRPPAMRSAPTWQTLTMLAGEYSKYLVVWAHLGKIVRSSRQGNY